MFFIKRSGRTETIGIVGCGSGVGATHLAILLANYSASKLKMSTALAECHESGDLGEMQKLYEGLTELPENQVFHIRHVTYYRNVVFRQIPDIYNENYERIILDLGSQYEKCREELLRCDRKIIAGSLSEWKVKQFRELIKNLEIEKGSKNWCYCAFSGSSGEAAEIRRKMGVKVNKIPFEPDAFFIQREHFREMEQFIH